MMISFINPVKNALTDWQFLVSLGGFLGLLYFIHELVEKRNRQGMMLFQTIKEDDGTSLGLDGTRTSQNKFSKTFGRERTLDALLISIDKEEEEKNQNNNKSKESEPQLTMDDLLNEQEN